MRPQRFQIGQAVTPKSPSWVIYSKRKWWQVMIPDWLSIPDRWFGKVFKVKSYHEWDKYPNDWFIKIEPDPSDAFFFEECFEPVITDSQLEELLSEVPQIETVR